MSSADSSSSKHRENPAKKVHVVVADRGEEDPSYDSEEDNRIARWVDAKIAEENDSVDSATTGTMESVLESSNKNYKNHGDALWYYRTESKQIFGPFEATEMREWKNQGWFKESLLVTSTLRTTGKTRKTLVSSDFVSLGSLGENPFVSSNGSVVSKNRCASTSRRTVLSCPCCFTVLCFHAKLVGRYSRTDYVAAKTFNCRIDTEEILDIKARGVASAEMRRLAQMVESETLRGGSLHPLECAVCSTEVGAYRSGSCDYLFFEAIPGY